MTSTDFGIRTKRYLIQGSKETTACNFENSRVWILLSISGLETKETYSWLGFDKDRIYKSKGALTKVDLTKDRVDHKTHLSLLSLSHISGTFLFNFRNDDLPRILGFGQNVISFKGARKQRPVILKRTETKEYFGEQFLDREHNATKQY